MEPLARIRETARGIAQILKVAAETSKDATKLLNTVYATNDVIREINRIGGGKRALPENEKAELIGAALDVMNTHPESKQMLLRIIREYGKAYETNKMADEHRQVILKHLQANVHPTGLKKMHDVLRAINSAEKEHVGVIVGALDKHGLENVHPVARAYLRGDPSAKKIIAEALKRAESVEHVQRIQYHAQKLMEMHPEVKKRVAGLIKNTTSFDEVDSLIMAAHHASGALRAGGRQEDILSAFSTKEDAIKRFGKPWKGWERM
ncbi:MAG: hypothetical protein GXN93_02200 [Candidatus Diapherotrites archaeon]|nr:hypothetical protein [Candidatus Diapherotrites archaeon]